jgi:hypothetical protein
MKFLQTYKLFEKSSLISIGVPYVVMQDIQKNYNISSDAQWEKVNKLSYENLFISICNDNIHIIFNDDDEYYIQNYILLNKDDFGSEEWKKSKKSKMTIGDVIDKIKTCTSYKIVSGNWNISKTPNNSQEKIEEITTNFKLDFINNFNKIVKKLYGDKANKISNDIIYNLRNVKKGITKDEIVDIFLKSTEKVKEIEYYKNKSKSNDPYNMSDNTIKSNSLAIFDEYLISFENSYSEKYDEYLNIPIMLKKYDRDKIIRAFIIYLYSGKMIELK